MRQHKKNKRGIQKNERDGQKKHINGTNKKGQGNNTKQTEDQNINCCTAKAGMKEQKKERKAI